MDLERHTFSVLTPCFGVIESFYRTFSGAPTLFWAYKIILMSHPKIIIKECFCMDCCFSYKDLSRIYSGFHALFEEVSVFGMHKTSENSGADFYYLL